MPETELQSLERKLQGSSNSCKGFQILVAYDRMSDNKFEFSDGSILWRYPNSQFFLTRSTIYAYDSKSFTIQNHVLILINIVRKAVRIRLNLHCVSR